MGYQLNTMDEETVKVGLMIHNGNTTCMTNVCTTDNKQIDRTEIEKITD